MRYRNTILATFLIGFTALALFLAPAESVDSNTTPKEEYVESTFSYVDNQGMVDYAALKKSPEDLNKTLAAMANLNKDTYQAWPEKQKIAFWINAYNALTLDAIIDHYPIQGGGLLGFRFPKNSIRQISGVWDELTWQVMGQPRTLNAIEHEILRVKFEEPRLHMAIVCASISCPYLRNEPFTAQKLDTQLAEQTKKFLAEQAKFKIDRKGNRVHISPIFDWFGEDFISKYGTEPFGRHNKQTTAVLNFIAKHIPPQDAAYLREGNYKVKTLNYDWALNEQ